ncbi:MAG: NAD-binding protein [Geminicoccaceae bacterium]
MKVIVAGAGLVGFNIARYLAAAGNDVVIIDQRPELVRKIGDSLDIQAMVGHASHPSTLEHAGAADADMFIAVTQVDEVNMVACQVGTRSSTCRPRSPGSASRTICRVAGRISSAAIICRSTW